MLEKSVRAACVLVMAFVMCSGVLHAQDADNDGLPDSWETAGHGPLNPVVHGCSPRRADLILVVCLRPGMTREQVQPDLDKVKQLYSRIPGRNPDGTTGVNIIQVWGNVVPPSDGSRDYEVGVPAEWRDMAHGMLLENGPGGGGQTRGNWSATGFDWHLVAHELGHQLGLDHIPLGSDRFSPFYTSLMNYDYQDSFNGDGDAVRFSRGEFSSIGLRETALPEDLPLPAATMSFLAQEPYNFTLRSVVAGRTNIDWNRNGAVGEPAVRADINDGSSVHIGTVTKSTLIVGSPALVALGNKLIAIYPESSTATPGTETNGLTRANRGKLGYVVSNGTGFTAGRNLVPAGVSGEVSAVDAFGLLFDAVPLTGGWMLEARRLSAANQLPRVAFLFDTTPGRLTPTLVHVHTRTPERLVVFLWNEETKGITYREVLYNAATARITFGEAKVLRMGVGATAPPILSDVPVGVVYNTKTERLMLATTRTRNDVAGRLRLTTLGRLGDTDWYGQTERWVGGDAGWEFSHTRPSLTADPVTGNVGIYFKCKLGDADSDPGVPGQIVLARQTADRADRDGWRSRFMIDVWNTSRSAPAAITRGNEIAFAFRWFDSEREEEKNLLHLYTHASGIDSAAYADYDDVSHIFNRGLRQSLGR